MSRQEGAKKMKAKERLIFGVIANLLIFSFAISFVSALEPTFAVVDFSCSPSESAINNAFSCSAQVKNTGDLEGSFGTATLYDSGGWLESSTYAQASGTNIDPGQTTTVTFTGMKAVKSGNNGFSKIMLDNSEDKYVVNNNKKVNIVDVAVSVSNSGSSFAVGGSITTTVEVTAGGNIDVILSFTRTSGSCSIGSETNPKTISDMNDGAKQSRTWTITQGSSGSCVFRISAAATGEGSVAAKTDTATSTITCTDCSGGGAASGGGAGGGGAIKVYLLGKFSSSQLVELLNGDKIKFNILENEYTIALKNHTASKATFYLEGKYEFDLSLDEEKNLDLNSDGVNEVAIKLKTIKTSNLTTGSIEVVLTPLVIAKEEAAGEGVGGEFSGLGKLPEKTRTLVYVLIGVFAVVAVVAAYFYFIKRKKEIAFGRTMGKRKLVLGLFVFSLGVILVLSIFTFYRGVTGYITQEQTGLSGQSAEELSDCENLNCEFGCYHGACVTKSTSYKYYGGGGYRTPSSSPAATYAESKMIVHEVGEITSEKIGGAVKDEGIQFSISGNNYIIALTGNTEVSASFNFNKQTFTLNLGEEKLLDVDGDGANDVKIVLKSVNVLTDKVNIFLRAV